MTKVILKSDNFLFTFSLQLLNIIYFCGVWILSKLLLQTVR